MGKSIEERAERIEIQVSARDGYQLGATLYDPAGASGTVIVFGATAVPQTFYDRFARFLASEGLRVVTFDYRGIGRSRRGSLRGLDATMTDWATLDAAGVLDEVRRRFGPRFAFVGHSFGGQLVGLVPETATASGAIFTGAQLGYYGHWPALARVRLGALWHLVVPALVSMFGYLPGKAGLGTDLPAGVALEWARWCRDPQYLVGEHPEAVSRFANFRVPTAFISATDDDLAPASASRALTALLPREGLTLRVLRPEKVGAPIGHFGFFRPSLKDALWGDMAAFLRDTLAGRRPSMNAGEPPSPPPARFRMPTAEEVLADLEFGRS